METDAGVGRYLRNREKLEAGHAYDAGQERDACGVGLIASIDGSARRDVVTLAIDALKSVWHRGAVDADGKTGDGAGIHIHVPQQFFATQIALTGRAARGGRIGIGMVFLPRTDYAAQEVCRTIVEGEILKFGYYIYGWRQVPVDVSVIGEKANATRPEIEQILFDTGSDKDVELVERDLFIIRRRIEKRVRESFIRDFYVCSLSTRSLIYKGMFLAEQLSVFYPDLQDPLFVSPMAIFHQRYSTNTFPTWYLAHPFRMLAHNGEINTLKGNVNWMKSHERKMASEHFGEYGEDIKPIVQPGSSDSAALDAVFEVLCRAGRSAPMAKTLLIPEAWSKMGKTMPDAWKALYGYANSVMEPWDGPAALCATDGRWVIAGLDRNGLRPLRYSRTSTGLICVGSETGMVPVEERQIVQKGRIGPGQMIAVDLTAGRFFEDEEIKNQLASEKPYQDWINGVIDLQEIIGPGPEPRAYTDPAEFRRRQLAAGFTHEDLEMVLMPMVEDVKEPVGSMGDDAPLAILSEQYRPLTHYFRQNFSQVTNPPIDSLREDRVMSLRTRFRNLQNVLAQDKSQVEVFTLESPVISTGMYRRIAAHLKGKFKEIDCTFAVSAGQAEDGALQRALENIQRQAEDAVSAGTDHLILTDERIHERAAAIPMVLATGAVHSHLVKKGLRAYASVNVRSAECLDTHYFAVLIGVGATTVNAYLAEECILDRHARGLFPGLGEGECIKRYLDAVGAGLLKIISKMGISVISSYRGGYNFEAIGLSRSMVAEYFPGMPSRISGIGLAGIQERAARLHAKAWARAAGPLPAGGLYRWRGGGETHAHSAASIHLLQEAVRDENYSTFRKYVSLVQESPPVSLRHLMDFRPGRAPVPLEDVEHITAIRKRFVTPGMSLGALSPEAHGALNVAMNRIGAKSDSGEGGEDPARYRAAPGGDNANSAIKQVASGRFGVTAEYLNQARELEIKIAQGAKPGEGGQLPGFKVTEMIAKLRHATPGVSLISPPPHHDIYSIEDLAQLIYDLKQINPIAKVTVKLVASTGIGTIAAGVAKAKADVILISGHVGGTGASPLTSIKYAGAPWEMGLTEVNQVLTLNNLRHRVTLRTDGGLRIGRDIVMAAMMGAEEYGIGTAALVAMGCIMVRQCHSNTCPVGVCTQDKALRAKFKGDPAHVVTLMSFIARDVREILASLGFRSLREVIGRSDLLIQKSRGAQDLDDLDLNPLLVQPDPGPHPRYCTLEGRNEVPDTLDAAILKDAEQFLQNGEKKSLNYTVRNTMRAIGSRTSSHIVRHKDRDTFQDGQLTIGLDGSAGQSLGAFAVKGLKLQLNGDANDYVGKGLSGGIIVVRPPVDSTLRSNENVIIGNTVLYGATAGKLFAAGQAGERFAVRNSGAETVVEGCGSNGCEYMTGGIAVILGPVGENFAAGMTGGMAFVYDAEGAFLSRLNTGSVVARRVESAYWAGRLVDLVEEHTYETKSAFARGLLAQWDAVLPDFWQICPLEMVGRLRHPLSDRAPLHERTA